MNFADVSGTLIHYQVIGAPEGRPTLVFANALGTDFRIWRDVIVRFVGECGIVMYDLRGHGLSDVGEAPYSIDDHVSDLAGLLDHLGAEQAVICGLSVGGLIAQGLAVERPDLVRALVLCCTQARFGDRTMWDERIATVRDRGLEAYAEDVVERWFTDGYKRSQPHMVRGWASMVGRQPEAGYTGTCTALRDADLRSALPDLGVPTMVIGGEDDASCPPDAMVALAKAIPDARYESLQDCGHMPSIEQPELMAEIIKAFLTDADIA